MRMRRFLQIFVILGALTGFAVSALAAAQTTGVWTVGPIQAANGATQHCSMKNRYNTGEMLVFARNKTGGDSIAVDFGRDILHAGRQYAVSLNVPPSASRDMTATASTESVLLMNIGQDVALYDALSRKQALYLTVSDQQFSFALTGTSDAFDRLDVCGVEIGAVAPPAVQPFPTFEPTVSAQSRFPQAIIQVHRPEERCAATRSPHSSADVGTGLIHELGKLQAVNEQLLKENELITSKIKTTQAAIQKIHGDADSAVSANEKLKSVNAELKQDLQALNASVKTAAQIQAENAALKRQVTSLQREAQMASRTQAQNTDLKEQLVSLQDAVRISNAAEIENARLKQELTSLQSAAAAVSTLEVSNDDLRQEIATLRQRGPLSLANVQTQASQFAALAPAAGRTEVINTPSVRQTTKDDITTKTWEEDGIFIQAQTMPRPVGRDFSRIVNEYFETMAARCGGDFAHTLSTDYNGAGIALQSAEMACLDGRNDAAAALVFVLDGETFSVVTHEGSTAQVRDVLAKRDAFYQDVYQRAVY